MRSFRVSFARFVYRAFASCIVRFSYRSFEAFVRFVCVFRSFAFGAYCKLIRSRICINFLETLEDYLIHKVKESIINYIIKA